MSPTDLMVQALRAFHFKPATAEEYARLTPRWWLVGSIEIPPDRKPHEREVAEWNALYALGRMA